MGGRRDDWREREDKREEGGQETERERGREGGEEGVEVEVENLLVLNKTFFWKNHTCQPSEQELARGVDFFFKSREKRLNQSFQ